MSNKCICHIHFDSMTLLGRYLDAEEHAFVTNVIDEIDGFYYQRTTNSILIFPPLLKRYRYLLHQIILENYEETFSTKSVGREGHRRTFVYYKNMDEPVDNDSGIIDLEFSQLSVTSNREPNVKQKRKKRPDKKLYVPPKAQLKPICTENNTPARTENDDRYSSQSSKMNASKNGSEFCDTKSQVISSDDEFQRNESDTVTLEHNDSSGDWETMFDDNGDLVKPDLLQHLHVGIKDGETVKIERTKLDYLQFQPYDIDIDENSEFSHILEIYDFPPELKTQDLMTTLSVFNSRDFDIKWVDDSHALVVFSSPVAASEAMKMPYHNMKLRPLSQAIRESKAKARKCSEFLRPYRQRPQTSAVLARRLVTGALGLKVNITPEQRAAERRKLQEAKERRQRSLKLERDVWEGKVT